MTSALTLLALMAGCGPSIESHTVADYPPVPEEHQVVFTETTPNCDRQKVGDIRVKASQWPKARAEVQREVREMGGEAVVRWNKRDVVVDRGGAGGSAVPGASGARAHRVAYFFGVVVRLPEDCAVG